MRYSQKILYLFEQLQMLEKAIVQQSHEQYKDAFDGKKKVSIDEPGFTKAFLYEHFMLYEGPILARYMIVIQLYSLFERYSIFFAKEISKKNKLIEIADLNGGQNFRGIKNYYTKVSNINYLHWTDLDTLRQVRNLIAHCDGYVTYSDQKNKIAKLADSDTNMIILSNDRLALDEEFLKRSFRVILKFFDIVEPMAYEQSNSLDFSWGHIKQFKEFDIQSTET